MANTHVYGIRYFRHLGGAETPQLLLYPIASAYAPNTTFGGGGTAVNLNIGDPVGLLADGTLALVQEGADVAGANTDLGEQTLGVIGGFPRVIVGGFPRPGSFYTSGTVYTGGIGGDTAPLAAIFPCADNIFEIDANAVVGAGTKNACMAVIGHTASIDYVPLTSGTGQPKANPLLNVATLSSAAGTEQQQLVIVGLGKKGDVMDFASAGVTFQVMFTYKGLTTPNFGGNFA